MDFYETSAKTGAGVEEAFKNVAKKLMEKKLLALAQKKEKSRQKPGSSSTQSEKKEESSSSKVALDTSKSNPQTKQDPNNCNC